MRKRERMISFAITLFLYTVTVSIGQPHAASLAHVPVSVRAMDLSTPPSTSDIMAAGQLGGQLYPTHEVHDKARQLTINGSFAEAIQEWNKHEYRRAVGLFKKHLEDYPDSPWAAEAVLHIGCDAHYNGRYTEAEEGFGWIREAMEGSDHEGAKRLWNKATLRLATLRVSQNNFSEAQGLFRDLRLNSPDWRDRTYASHWIQRLSRSRGSELAMLNCGTKALSRLLEKSGRSEDARKITGILPETARGHSMKSLKEIAADHGYALEALRLSPADIKDIPLPAVMHIRNKNRKDSGHYWILEKVERDALTLFDPQGGRYFYQTVEEFAKEWSGDSLVFGREKNHPGLVLSGEQTESVFGGCCGVPRPEDDLGCPEGKCKGASGVSGGGSSNGAPVWSVNMVNLNFYMMDTPLWYWSPIGPSVEITLTYNSQSAIAQHEPFGNKWQFNYGSTLVVDTGGQVTLFMPDGRRDVYSPDGSGSYTRPYHVYNTLTKKGENRFELRFPDDTVYVYDIPAGTSSLQPFLVEIRDAYGQKLAMTYDTNVHLTTVTDPMGKTTALTYDPFGLVSKVTDPFGREANFTYDANRNLTKITDMGGYSTNFAYDQNVYLTSLMTSAGTWGFHTEPADGIDNGTVIYPVPGDKMWENYRLTVTNPLGGKEEFYYDGYHGTAWYVSPRDYIAYASSTVNNYNSAVPMTKYELLPSTDDQPGQVLDVAYPENRNSYFFGYDKEGNVTIIMGPDIENPKRVTGYTYNSQGSVTSVSDTDATNYTKVSTSLGYAPNGVDLTTITNGLGTITLAYDAFHNVTSRTDRLGNKHTYAYNSFGQLTTIKDPLGVETSYTYDGNHLLTGITRDGKALAAFTYDSKRRTRTYTDASGHNFSV